MPCYSVYQCISVFLGVSLFGIVLTMDWGWQLKLELHVCQYFVTPWLINVLHIFYRRKTYTESGQSDSRESSVCLSVRHTLVSALYLLNPWWDLQITLHKCQVWWNYVPCLWLESGQGHNLRLNIVWLYFVSALNLLNPLWDLQITLLKCQLCWDDVQCLYLTKVGSRSRSELKIKHLYVCISCRLYIFWTPVWIYKLLCTNVKNDEMMCSVYLFKVKVTVYDLTLYDCIWCPLYIFWTSSGIYK